MRIFNRAGFCGAALLAGLSLLLSGCFITPGKFTSELVLLEENRFEFTYEGEIYFLALSNLAAMGAATEEFVPDDCYNEETYEIRECTEAELAEQRATWDSNAEFRAQEAARQAEQMAQMMGGIDPSDPEARAQLVALLERHRGWERVEDLGDGVFEVTYRVSGELSHDFIFPVIEGFPLTSPFVQMHLRDENRVRVNAPGFAAQGDNSMMGGMPGGMAGLAGIAGMEAGQNGEIPTVPIMEGTFTIVTNGVIRANNTDEGSITTARGEELVWQISPRTAAAPTALIDLSR